MASQDLETTQNMAAAAKFVPSFVSSAGTSQNTATILTSRFNVITVVAPGSGVMVTTTYAKVWNAGANSLLIYPPVGAQFDAVGINSPIAVPVGGAVEIGMMDGTQGYAR